MDFTNFYTATLAKVYAKQGYLEKAAQIYKSLLEREPKRPDLIEALSEIEKENLKKSKMNAKNLVPIFSKWIELILRYNKLQNLKKLKNRMEAFKRNSQ
ncbi:MAG: hypothetical protein JW786_00160 [Desulfobacterales bacterium]|nr:hypothetical protein [Desulfobacterales bacterium]